MVGARTAGQVRWLVRLQKDTRWTEAEPEPLGPAEKAAGVWWAGTVRLGLRGEGPRVRVVEVLGADELVVLATNVPAADLPAADAAARYRHRWQIELFFRWLKSSWAAGTGWPRAATVSRCRCIWR